MLNFIGIGAQKAATTWLYEMLLKHPEIKFPGGKEVHFWNQNIHNGLDWYKSIFANEVSMNGDITPAYGHLEIEKINQIYSIYPNLKMIYILRNPIERAWSSAKMALSRSELMFHEVSDQWFIEHFNSVGSIARSDYEVNIKRWLSVFPKAQLFLAGYEQVIQSPEMLLNSILNHLDLPDYYQSGDASLQLKINEGIPNTIRPLLKEYLVNMYQLKIQSLGDYLKQDLSTWLI